jgi:hypothetical protein
LWNGLERDYDWIECRNPRAWEDMRTEEKKGVENNSRGVEPTSPVEKRGVERRIYGFRNNTWKAINVHAIAT